MESSGNLVLDVMQKEKQANAARVAATAVTGARPTHRAASSKATPRARKRNPRKRSETP
jgi:hypothetical protein